MSDAAYSPKESPSQKLRRLLTEKFHAFTREPRTPFLPYTKDESARSRAEERRRRLRAELSEAGSEGFLRREFIETPPGLGDVRTVFFENVSAAFGQMARLRWQLDADELLLAERLIDAVIILKRRAGASSEQTAGGYPLVKIEPIKAAEGVGLFPWKAVIETDEQEFYVEHLTPLKDWLGIGVDFAPGRKIRFLSRCVEAGGAEGKIGGLVEDSEQFAMTCHHVLAPSCGSVKERGNPYSKPDLIFTHPEIDNEPDAALVDVNTPCLEVARGSRKRRFTSATAPIASQLVARRAKVLKLSARPKTNPGFVFTTISMMPVSEHGAAFRFPHIEIKPFQQSYLYDLVKLPLFNNRFSQPGESGSWVISSDLDIWLGMVIAGMDDGTTFAALGQPLLDFFELKLKNRRGSAAAAKLAPFTRS